MSNFTISTTSNTIVSTLPEIPNHIMEEIRSFGFKTGSHVYGVTTPDSDIDFVMFPGYTRKVPAKYFTTGRSYDDSKTISIKGHYDGITINLILTETSETYTLWYRINTIMKLICNDKPDHFFDKEYRCNVHKFLRDNMDILNNFY